MIRLDTEVILPSGDAITAEEIFEGLARLAKAESPFPILDASDGAKALISVTFEALDWARERGIL